MIEKLRIYGTKIYGSGILPENTIVVHESSGFAGRCSEVFDIQCIIERSNALRLIGLFVVFGHSSELSDITFRDIERYYLLEWLWWPFLFVKFLDESRRNFSGFCNVTVQKFSLAR